MRYLFFDIECANCFNGQGKICSFGYTIIDKHFNVLEQQDIIVNPKSKFHLGPSKGEPAIQLAYEESDFKKAPDFSHRYDFIRELLTRDDQIVFGHSVGNDLTFILSDCKRYKKDIFYVKAYDSQVIYKQLKKEKNDSGLEKLCELYNIVPQHMHRSDCDAWVTMQVIHNLCVENNTDIDGLLELCPTSYMEVINGGIVKQFNNISNSKRLYSFAKKIKIDKAIKIKALIEKYFAFSEVLEDDNYELVKALVSALKKRGGQYCSKPRKCQYFINGDEKNTRFETAIRLIGEGVDIKILTVQEFKDLIKLSEEQLDEELKVIKESTK